jgi:hypothetical protein
MIEREMEDLLAAYPDEFFPRKSFVLKGRQQSFAGVGRFDLLFQDQFQTNILMELKARPANYEDATQLAKYKDELERRGEKNILMWLVARHIPNSVREFLDQIGIEYSEIHVAEFRRVAERHGVVPPSEPNPPEPPVEPPQRTPPRVDTGPSVVEPSSFRWKASGRALVLQNPDAFDPSSLW